MSNTIHPSAIVSEAASLGENNTIGPHVIIEEDVRLGNDNTLMAGVVLKAGSRLGDGNTIHEYTVIGGLPQDLGFDGRATAAEIGNGNTLREYVTVNRATREGGATRLGNDNYLMVNTHIAHDCALADNIILAPEAALGGHVHVQSRAFISGGVMVHQFTTIGTLAMVGGNAKITQDVLPFMITDGNPARLRGLNVVGLRRNGYGRDEVRVLKEIYQLINRSGLAQEQFLARIASLDSPLARQFVQFIENAKRGFHREKS